MQSDQQFYNINGVPPLSYQVDRGGYINSPIAPTLGVTLPPSSKQSNPFHGVELQPFEVCPKNFIIFDHTDNRSRVMFHPALTRKFSCPDVNFHRTYVQDNDRVKDTGTENGESSYPLKEDTNDIDALLSLDYEEDEDEYEDEEEVSTARTFGSSSSDSSCSSYGSKPSNLRMSSSTQRTFSCNGSSSNSERKRQKMKKMMKALKGIVPGADQMNSAVVLDEAVKYLKSLKVEVKKLGIGNFQE